MHTVHRWGDYTGGWRPLEIHNDAKPKNQPKAALGDDLLRLKKAAASKRKNMLLDANRKEDENLKQLEKQLSLKKRKGKKEKHEDSIPKSFLDDGLGYILEACDSKTLKNFTLKKIVADMKIQLKSDETNQKSLYEAKC